MSAYNGSGTFVISGAGLPVVTATTISSTVANQLNSDLASGLSTAICKDGQTTVTANLPMATFRHTGVGDAVARTDYGSAGQVQDGLLNWVAAGGTANAITATYSPAIAALVDGQLCFVRASAANTTTTPTFAPNGLTAHTITKNGGAALAAGDIPAALAEIILRYNLANTRWELLNPTISISGTFTLADASGASLVVSSNGYYRRVGNMVTCWGSVTYPANANGAPMSLSGMPFTSANLTTQISGFVGHGNFTGNNPGAGGGPFFFVVPQNTATFIIRGVGGTQLTNTEMSTWTVNFNLSYPL